MQELTFQNKGRNILFRHESGIWKSADMLFKKFEVYTLKTESRKIETQKREGRKT